MQVAKTVNSPLGEPRSENQSQKFEISREVRSSLASDRGNFWAFLVSLLFIILQTIMIGIYFRNLPPQIPIFYSETWGESMLGSNIFIWILPAIAFVFILLNFFIYFLFFRSNKFLSRVLFMSSVVIGFTTFWGSVKIITLLV